MMLSRIPYSNCPICLAPPERFRAIAKADATTHHAYSKELDPEILWLECDNCKHEFTSGYWPDKALTLLSSSHFSDQYPDNCNLELWRLWWLKALLRLRGFMPLTGASLLDVGFGNGTAMMAALELGAIPAGIDISDRSVEGMSNIGFAVSKEAFKDYAARVTSTEVNPHFDAIIMADVLEHMPFPEQALQIARQIIRYGGHIFISCPNKDIPAWQLLSRQDQNPYWMEIEHYHNFGFTELQLMLDCNAFSVVDYAPSERYRLCMEVIARAR